MLKLYRKKLKQQEEEKNPIEDFQTTTVTAQTSLDVLSDSVKKDQISITDDDVSSISNNSKWQDPTYFKSSWQEYTFIGTCMLANLLNQAGQTQTLSTMNVLADSLNSDGAAKTWLMASFTLASGSFILVSGRIGDIYGLKATFIGGNIIFCIWSILCGVSKYTENVTFFIICRAFQGLGVAFVLPNVMGLVGNIYNVGSMRKNIVISFIGCMAPVGQTFGGMWGGLIVDSNKDQWPWIFFATAIAVFINLIMGIYSIPNHVPTNIYNLKMDWIGSLLGVIGLILMNFVWNQAPISGWSKAYIIVILIVAVFFLVAFFIYELKKAESPLLPPEVTKNRHIVTIIISLFLGWGAFGIWTFYYYAFNLNLRHFSPLWAGSTHFVFIIFGSLTAITVAFTINKVGPSVLFCLSSIGFTCGNIIFSVTSPDQTYWRNSLGMQIILALGMDLSFPGSSIILSDLLPMQYQGMSGSLVNTITNYATSLCLGMGTTAEVQYNNGGKDVLKGYRAALYVAIGLGALGFAFSFSYMAEDLWIRYRKRRQNEKKEDKC
ncbi:hypothetical protein KAFR_0B03940 [Kazachstania africana CBS 2517]|uniref:Major facilitator superfamily (MFS) profile domain-containing protein n=1 Tax=Kazachstania africana (strain ATCC 22294 / BCRC 22015 / CBS 2517 / CECT 1963 / NBRC 1671 / NRRL Y-8276) TaxID=1071382 RepID=H2AQP0_KAZAF|nr:hypothetical protein KAFR_0B03940 [Kazachstania africana CBS 2517]CCF56690.1 hypothetical protein KAFR_0B03940 [Kazachstania africana CBS 2517]